MKLILTDYANALTKCSELLGTDYFVFSLSYIEDRPFREIDRFLWESRHEKCRFSNRYTGPVCIDLTEWSGKMPNLYFDAFSYFLKDLGSDCPTVLISEKRLSEPLRSRLERFFELEVTNLLESKGKEEPRVIGFAVQEEIEYV